MMNWNYATLEEKTSKKFLDFLLFAYESYENPKKLYAKHKLLVECVMSCKRTFWKIVDVAKQKIIWKTNWTSEFFLEAETANVQVCVNEVVLA